MGCDRSEEVSLLIDGELPEARTPAVREHLSGCPECDALVREEEERRAALAAGPPDADVEVALQAVLRRGSSRFWHRRVQLPLPLAAGIAMALLGALLWAVLAGGQVRGLASDEVTAPSAAGGTALDRLDHGGAPVLYTSRRTEGQR